MSPPSHDQKTSVVALLPLRLAAVRLGDFRLGAFRLSAVRFRGGYGATTDPASVGAGVVAGGGRRASGSHCVMSDISASFATTSWHASLQN